MKYILLLLSVLSIFETAGQSSSQSIYERRNYLLQQAAYLIANGQGYSKEYISILKNIAATDTDTFLVAAKSYGRMQSAFAIKGDTTLAKITAETELYYVNKSLAKYPDNFDAYVYRLSIYKFSMNKEGEATLIKTFQEKFSTRWEMNFVLAEHHIYYDYVWPDSKEFDICTTYLKKAIAINPNEFNSLLLLSVAYENNKQERMKYLNKMYAIAPKQFAKNTNDNDGKAPYVVRSVSNAVFVGKDLTVGLVPSECTLLNLK